MKKEVADIPDRLSTMLEIVLTKLQEDEMSVKDFVRAFHERGFGLLLILFLIPLPIPKPPGVTSVMSIPAIIICIQMLCGAEAPWIPKSMARRKVSAVWIRKAIAWLIPKITKFERIFKPRLLSIDELVLARFVGGVGIVLCTGILIPFPGSDVIPAIILMLMAYALLIRDGLALFVLGTAGIIYMALLFTIGYTAIMGLFHMIWPV